MPPLPRDRGPVGRLPALVGRQQRSLRGFAGLHQSDLAGQRGGSPVELYDLAGQGLLELLGRREPRLGGAESVLEL